MNAWPPNTKHRGRRVRRGVAVSFMVFLGGCVAVNWVGDRLPSDVNVGSNLGPTPCDVTLAGQCARHLDPKAAPTTTVRATTTTATVYGPPNPTDYVLVIDGDVIRIPRSFETNAVVRWLITKGI